MNIDGGDVVQRVADDDDVVGDVVRIEGDYVGELVMLAMMVILMMLFE